MPAQKSKRGFTLIELMVAVSIVAILAAIGLASYSKSQIVARDSRRKQDLRSIQIALELFYQKNKQYPVQASWIFDATKDSSGKCILTSSWLTDSSKLDTFANYINTIPNDPKACGDITKSTSSATVNGYEYRSGSVDATSCPNANNQYYILGTVLENGSDSETNTKKQYKDCNGHYISDPTITNPPLYTTNLFAVTNP